MVKREAISCSVLCLAVSLVVKLADACMCDGPRTLQQHYCDADFVIKTKIMKQKPIFDENFMMADFPVRFRYDLKTFKVYKLEGTGSESVDTHVLYTGSTSCGRVFNVGKVYAIAGKLRNGEMWAETCDYATSWFTLSPHQKKYIKWKYRKHCDCNIQYLQYGDETGKASKSADTCSAHRSEWLCYAKHSYCERPHTRRSCSWQMNKPLKDCLRKLEP